MKHLFCLQRHSHSEPSDFMGKSNSPEAAHDVRKPSEHGTHMQALIDSLN